MHNNDIACIHTHTHEHTHTHLRKYKHLRIKSKMVVKKKKFIHFVVTYINVTIRFPCGKHVLKTTVFFNDSYYLFITLHRRRRRRICVFGLSYVRISNFFFLTIPIEANAQTDIITFFKSLFTIIRSI